MSEHQELIAVITALIAEQKRTTAAIEALGGIPTAEPKQKEPARYEEVADAIKEEMAKEEPLTDTPPTEADLKAALMAYKKATDAPTAKAMLTKFGAAKLSDVKESDRKEMIMQMAEGV